MRFISQASDNVGRKRSLISIAIPQIISWLLIIFARNWIHILVSRLLGGVSGGGIYIIIPLFISEISDDRFNLIVLHICRQFKLIFFRIRGRLGSVFVLASGVGILFAYTCGTFFSYTTLPFIYIPVTLLFLIGAMFHPESAHFLVKKGRNDVNKKCMRILSLS